MIWKRKDLLGIEDLTVEEIELILQTATSFKEVSTRVIKKVPALRGKTVVNLFFEPSTRTRTSFELAAKRLSADVVSIAVSTSSVVKGETLLDTAKTVQALGTDIVVVRHFCSGAPHILAKALPMGIVNAGDGMHEHPTQALLDMFTIKEKKGKIAGLKIVIVGDIAHSRVARSDIWGMTKMGAEVTVVGPATLMPAGIERLGVKICFRLEEALKNADVIYLLRIQKERLERNLLSSLEEYHDFFGVDTERLKIAKKGALVMHPGPMNRGIEIDSEVADSAQSVIDDQVTNGIAVRMAVLYLIDSAIEKGRRKAK